MTLTNSSPASVVILALDPSTDVTGAAVIRMPARGRPELLAWAWKDATHAEGIAKGGDLTARLSRIRWTRLALTGFIHKVRTSFVAIDIIAYETDTDRGHKPSEALKMAAGAYLSIKLLDGVKVVL